MHDFDGLVFLVTFLDALDTGKACSALDLAQIPFVLEDDGQRQQGINRFQGDPPVMLSIYVETKDIDLAKSLLRETMHLFPERELDENSREDTFSEGLISQAILCDELGDAEAISVMLSEGGIPNKIRKVIDDEELIGYSVDVKGEQIETAIRAVDRWVQHKTR